jgi:hypothetical protein
MTCYNPSACQKSPKWQSETGRCRACHNKALGERKLAWCPPQHRDEYRRLINLKRMTAVEARAVIMASI